LAVNTACSFPISSRFRSCCWLEQFGFNNSWGAKKTVPAKAETNNLASAEAPPTEKCVNKRKNE